MLGDVVGEGRGQLTGTRVLPSDGQGQKVEVSFQASVKLLGIDSTDMGTYWSVLKPDGTLFGEGQGLTMTTDGQTATWRGQGAGRLTGRGAAVRWRGAVYYQTASPKLARLNGMAVVYEYETDESGKTSVKSWEWK